MGAAGREQLEDFENPTAFPRCVGSPPQPGCLTQSQTSGPLGLLLGEVSFFFFLTIIFSQFVGCLFCLFVSICGKRCVTGLEV